MKFGVLLTAVLFSISSHAIFGSKDENAGKSKRQINQARAHQLCESIANQSTGSWCKNLTYGDVYFQNEALDLCEAKGGATLQFCVEFIRNRKYEGIYLQSLKSCGKYESQNLALRGLRWNDGTYRVEYEGTERGCLAELNSSMPKSAGESATYDLPDNTQLTIPVQFVTKSGKTCSELKISENQDLTCEACVKLTAEELKNDNAFNLAILEIKDSKFSVSSDSISLQIVNHNYITSVKCGGLMTPNGLDRDAVEKYFKAGGINLKFPAPIQRN